MRKLIQKTVVGQTMSLLKSPLKGLLFTGALYAVLFAAAGSALALDGGRLWKPYQPEEFGGGRRMNDGVYGSVEAIHWNLNRVKDMPVFYPIRKENVQASVDAMRGEGFSEDADTLKDTIDYLNSFGDEPIQEGGGLVVDSLSYDFSTGTRITFGNRRGHWGWLVRGYGIDLDAGYEDRRSVDWYTGRIPGEDPGFVDLDYFRPDTLWVRFALGNNKLSASSKINDIELMGTYRPHPFKWGSMELMAGVRYWDFKEDLIFSLQNHDIFYTYNAPRWSDWDDEGEDESDEDTISSMVFQMDNRDIRTVRNRITGPQFGFSIARQNKRWTFGAECIFIAGINNVSYDYKEVSKFALFGAGVSGGDNNGTTGGTTNGNSENAGSVNLLDLGDQAWVAAELDRLTRLTETQLRALENYTRATTGMRDTYTYHKRRTIFSPGLDLNLSAKWQWTDAVGIKFGFNSTMFDNIARGSDIEVSKRLVTTYPEGPDGNLIRNSDGELPDGNTKPVTRVTSTGNHNKMAISYGFSLGIEVKR